jgi:hypothetical protein
MMEIGALAGWPNALLPGNQAAAMAAVNRVRRSKVAVVMRVLLFDSQIVFGLVNSCRPASE